MIYCHQRDVAQLGSAAALGAVGRRFKSCRPDSLMTMALVRALALLNGRLMRFSERIPSFLKKLPFAEPWHWTGEVPPICLRH